MRLHPPQWRGLSNRFFSQKRVLKVLILLSALCGVFTANARPEKTPEAIKLQALRGVDRCLKKLTSELDADEKRGEKTCAASGCTVYLRTCSTAGKAVIDAEAQRLVSQHKARRSASCNEALRSLLEPTESPLQGLPFEAQLDGMFSTAPLPARFCIA
jgi:hypothetical protein